MTRILSIKPEDAKQLHPEVLKWFNDLSAAIEQQFAIDGLTVDDIEAFLSDDEKDELGRYKNEIGMGLRSCINPDAVYPDHLPYGNFGPVFMMMQLNSFDRIQKIKSLLRKVYGRKAAAKPEAVKKQDENERRTHAFEALRPPVAFARKYLNRPGEYEMFEMSINGAIDAYLEADEFYRYQEKASPYLRWLEAVEHRQREETRKQRAQSTADAYSHRLNEEIRKLTTRLYHEGKNLSSYFRATTQDKRYLGDNLSFVLSKDEEKDLDIRLVGAANAKLNQLCSGDLREFIVFPTQYYRRYFPLPAASYSFKELPCIDISFDIFAAAYAEVLLKPGKKIFGDYEFPLPLIEDKNAINLLQKPKFLGYFYLILRPEDIGGQVFWESIPLALLKGLLNGEIRPEGATISAASGEQVIYRIPKVEDKIAIPNSFAGYLKTIGTIDRMVDMDIMSKKVASIVIAELNGLKMEQEIPSPEDKVKRENTRKARAFQLFSQGKRPSDPEVKSLGIKPSSAYRYYQAWKKTPDHT
ncbi:hypothetical protein ACFLXC_01720 [Chloroflexota bacterium]